MTEYYRYYFEQLAVKHKQLQHAEGNASFFFLRNKYDLDAFDNALRSSGSLPALLLENYSYDAEDNQSRNYSKHMFGRFNILDKAQVGDSSSIDLVQVKCERIAEDIIAKMRSDLGEGGQVSIPNKGTSAKIHFQIRNLKLDFIGPVDNDFYGVTVAFSFKAPLNTAVDPDQWND